jgi:hypothetical protein
MGIRYIPIFCDAPGGFSEELKEFTYSVGAEYLFSAFHAIDTSNESPLKRS